MFDPSLLPSSFQTPTNSITSSQKISSFQQQSTPKLYSYNNNNSQQTHTLNVNSSDTLTMMKNPLKQQQTYNTASYFTSTQRPLSITPQNTINYNNLPPLQPISFNPTWPDKTISPLSTTLNRHLTNPSSTESSNADKLDQMRKDNFDLYFQNRNLKEEMAKIKEEFEVVNKQYQRIQKEMDAYKKDIDRSKILESLNANLKTEIGMVFDELRNEKNKVEALERQIEGFKEEIRGYSEAREKQKVAYKNLLSELHSVKNQLDNIKRGPTQIFTSANHLKLEMLKQETESRIEYLGKLREELDGARRVSAANQSQSQQLTGEKVIIGLQQEIREIKEKKRKETRSSKKIMEDQGIKNLKEMHQEEIKRLKREINKKAAQAQQLEEQLMKIGE